MANPKINGETNELQERYANTIKKLYRKPTFVREWFNRDFNGNPVAGAVEIPVRDTDVALSDYDVVDGVSLTTSATTYEKVLIDKTKSMNELIDGFEAEAVPDDLVAQRMESGSYSLAVALEKDAIKSLVDNGTTETSKTALTKDNAYSSISSSITKLKKLGIMVDRIKVAVSPDTEALLLNDAKFANTSGQLGAELVRSGVIGKINGAEVKMSPFIDDDENLEYIVFGQDYATAIDEFAVAPAINNLMDGKHIGASALQSRTVFKDYVSRKDAVRVKTKGTVSL